MTLKTREALPRGRIGNSGENGHRFIYYAVALSVAAGLGLILLYLILGSQSAPADPRFTRSQLEQEVLGTGKAHVLDVVGQPKSTSEGSMERYWYFERLTRDSTTGKVDRSVQIVFKDGKVIALNYQQ